MMNEGTASVGGAGTKGMASLSQKLDMCVAPIQGRTIYLDYPVHRNVGDLLIWKGAQKLLARNGIKPIANFEQPLGGRVKDLIGHCRTICMHGGGNFGDLYRRPQNYRERIVEAFPDKRIVIFPQTVHFDDRSELERSCRIFRSHNDLHIFLRDQRSYDVLRAQGLANLQLSPDTAHALWPIPPEGHTKPDSVLVLRRRDKEGSEFPALDESHASAPFDWNDLTDNALESQIYKFAKGVHVLDKLLGGAVFPCATLWNWEAGRLMSKAVKLFSQHEQIITNRLHAMILAALMGKRATIYDNSYGKVSGYFDLWLKDIPGLRFEQTQS
jgi:pyruvyl transferase EpsO